MDYSTEYEIPFDFPDALLAAWERRAVKNVFGYLVGPKIRYGRKIGYYFIHNGDITYLQRA